MRELKSVYVTTQADGEIVKPIMILDEQGAICIPHEVETAEDAQVAARFIEACAFKLLSFAERLRRKYGEDVKRN